MISLVIFALLCCVYDCQAKTDCDELRVIDSSAKELARVQISTQTVEVLDVNITALTDAFYFDIDSGRGLMFFTDMRKVWVADVNGTNAREYITLTDDVNSYFYGIAVDPVHQKIFVADYAGSRIGSINYPEPDPSDPVFFTFDNNAIQWPVSIALDTGNQVIYWADYPYFAKMNYDGTEVEFLMDDLIEPWNIDVDEEDEKVYWLGSQQATNQWFHIIGSMNLDGSDIQILFNETGRSFIDVKSLGDYLYISEYRAEKRNGLVRLSKDGGPTEEFGDQHFGYATGVASYCPEKTDVYENPF